VLLFQIINGKKVGTSWVARRFPVRIGRKSSSELCLEEPGVWDYHLQINLRPDRSFEALVEETATATVNGESIRNSVVHNGDVFQLGSVKIRIGLSAAAQRSLRVREVLTWVALAALSLGQVAVIYLLG
jgi:pSer/pThr/pTyr-binding forkhead associated (FHA) protein